MTYSDPNASEMHKSVEEAISQHVTDGIVTAWALVVEITHADGTCSLGRVASSGIPSWRVDGMLHVSLHGASQWDDIDG